MPIEICSSQSSTNLLTNSINRIEERIENNLIENIPIVVSDLNNIRILFPSNAVPDEFQWYSRLLKKGIGITQPKTFLGGERKHLIVINTETIARLNLSDSELDAVIAHELGHIFNDPNRNNPNYNEDQEFYADHFVRSIGLSEPLLSSIEKFLEQDNSQNSELFKLRIKHLTEENNFDNGNVRTL